MILEKLTVENFRQFAGRQELAFAPPGQGNVTLLHAENGFGKTALLNALLWGFYGHEGLTEDLAHKNRIIHEGTAHRSRDPEETRATVSILFRHEDVRYTLTRSLTLAQQKADARKTELTLDGVRGGEFLKEKLPQQRIQSMIPDGISRLLFFNGERIDQLSMEQNAAEIRQAIEQMLGLGLLRTAIEDLMHVNVRGKLRAELREHTSAEKAELLDRQTALDAEIEGFAADRARVRANLAALDQEMTAVNAKLEANRVAYELQVQREQLEKRQTEQTARLKELEKRLGQLISEDSYVLFAEDLVKRGREITGKLRAENKIPARVLNTFIEELLQRGSCICTRCLAPGSPERQAVEALLQVAGDQQFNNAVSALDNALGVMESSIPRTRQDLANTNRDRLKLIEDHGVTVNLLAEIHQKLGSKDDEEVQDLERTRAKLQQQREVFIGEDGRIKGKLEEHEEEREELRRQIQAIEDSEADALRAQRRLTAVEESIALLERVLQFETEDLRPVLNQEIDRHFRRIIDRGYWAELSDNFILSIRKEVGTLGDSRGEVQQLLDVALSTGQRQITSLVFIASLVSLAQRRAEIPTILRGLGGAEYPMVMDSPFGQLSTLFRGGVARWIPDLAPQVAIFVSSTQYDGPVADELRKSKRVGKRYYLCYHGPKIRPEAKAELVLDGVKLEQYVEADEERTEIREA